MARARSADSSTPRQLTLDDWAETVRTEREESLGGKTGARSRMRAAVTADERSVASAAARDASARHHPVATDLLAKPEALLTRSHLRELGLERRAIDAVFRALPVVALPGYSRPMIRVEQYLELMERHTFRDDRVRPSHA